MSYSVKTIAVFEKQSKRLINKYPSLKNELKQLINSLKENPTQGNAIGQDCYKIRIAIASKGKGKSGGGRVISHLHISHTTVYLISIYDKSEQDNIPDADIRELVKNIIP